ncbi:aminopeptidase P [Arctopsyche grandis]|uniref:aminopeptidase P n=1 Tax=Arctopsyche grandis TaxID=121162 RepID=UPI00406D8BA7
MTSQLASSAVRLARLRALMKSSSELKAYIIPTADAHQSEYISSYDSKRAFISGFTGSAGTVIVTPDEALLWTDGRYYLQASTQLDSNWQLMKESLPTTLSRDKWLVKNLPPKSNVGANPMLLSNAEWEPLQTALHKAGHTLIPVETDLIDTVWNEDEIERPKQPSNSIFPLPLKFSGKSISEKLNDIREKMVEKNASILIITALDSVAYLLNLRGSDIPYNPVFYSYVIVTRQPDQIHFVTRPELFDQSVEAHFDQEGIKEQLKIHPYTDILNVVQEIVTTYLTAKSESDEDTIVWVSHGSSRAIHLAAKVISSKTDLVTDITPIDAMKAVKNDVETQGMINSHVRDGAALAQFFSWLEDELVNKGNKSISEISAADALEKFRSQLPLYVGLSFNTISSSGPNGAVIHYDPEPETNRILSVDDLYLCDSGAQFWDGTTDVTRTMHFGQPTKDQIEAFTLVLKGQIALGTSVFPTRIKGNVLDTLARRYLWQKGMNYAHGTGHGIGYFLNVHEGPMGISWREMPDDPGLVSNMFLSNEPGYYENGEYGIRIEDIIRIVTLVPPGDINTDTPLPRGLRGNFAGQGALGFETITMSPIQRKMIDINMLTDEEIQYIDNYHSMVLKKVSPVLDSLQWGSAKSWLAENTKPLRG